MNNNDIRIVMRKIIFFGEDIAHRKVIGALIFRLAQEEGAVIKFVSECEIGVSGVENILKIYLRDVKKYRRDTPDLLVVVRDANRRGYSVRYREIENIVKNELKESTGNIERVIAIPDPHIERWLLLDSEAFRIVVGRGCKAPKYNNDKGYYKKLLLDAILEADKPPPSLGGIEYAEDIMNAMDIQRVMRADASFKKFVEDIRRILKQWK